VASWNFDQVPAGGLPDRWLARQNGPTTPPAAWKITRDADAPSPPNVLSVETQNENRIFNLALVEGTSFQNLDLRVKIRANTGKLDQGGGLVWRAKDEHNYYVCRINPLEANYRVYKVVDGQRKQLGSANVPTETGQWYTVRAVMVGDHIQCYLDGRKLLDVRDETFPRAGMIGLWTKADASSSFDNLLVRQPPPQQE